MSSDASSRAGQWLFRFRSITPVPVLALVACLLAWHRGTPGPGGAQLDFALNAVGLLSAAVGQALRFYTLGWVPEGTSGQGNVLEASVLNTRGPYAFVRNPLYVGNWLICLGLMLIAHDVAVYAVGTLFFFGEYFFIIRAEENFLRSRFKAEFDAYCSAVRRWLPRWAPAFDGRLRDGHFDVARAFKKEHNPAAAWLTAALALLGWELWARGALEASTGALFVAAEASVLLAFISIKAWKRGWLKRRVA